MAGPLIGRADELETVLALIADPAVRAVVLAGPSGVGKTTLALAALDASGFGHRGHLGGAGPGAHRAAALVAGIFW